MIPTSCCHKYVVEEQEESFHICYKEGGWTNMDNDDIVYDVVLRSNFAKSDRILDVKRELKAQILPQLYKMLDTREIKVFQ